MLSSNEETTLPNIKAMQFRLTSYMCFGIRYILCCIIFSLSEMITNQRAFIVKMRQKKAIMLTFMTEI